MSFAAFHAAVRIQTADFDVGQELARLRANDAGVGAVCSFVGTVRAAPESVNTDLVSGMEIEHYPGMTERAIHAMAAQAGARFGLHAALVIHRIGPLQPQDQIVLVAVTAAHRRQSFEACEFLMDYLKTHAPFWKKEHTSAGSQWVDARESDNAALARWNVPDHCSDVGGSNNGDYRTQGDKGDKGDRGNQGNQGNESDVNTAGGAVTSAI